MKRIVKKTDNQRITYIIQERVLWFWWQTIQILHNGWSEDQVKDLEFRTFEEADHYLKCETATDLYLENQKKIKYEVVKYYNKKGPINS